MRSPLVAFPDAPSARSGGDDGLAVVPLARRAMGLRAAGPARGGGGRARQRRDGRPGLAADRRPGVLDDAGHRRPADLHEHPDAVPGPAAGRAGRQPDRRVPATRFRVPRAWRGRQVVLHVGGRGERALRLRQRSLRRLRAPTRRLATELDLTALPAAGRERPGLRGRALVGAHSYLEDQDHWWMAGLHREVHLEARAPVHLADVRVDAGLTDDRRRAAARRRTTVGVHPAALVEPGWTVRGPAGGARAVEPSARPMDRRRPPRRPSLLLPRARRGRPRARPSPASRPWSAEAPAPLRVVVTLLDPDGRGGRGGHAR